MKHFFVAYSPVGLVHGFLFPVNCKFDFVKNWWPISLLNVDFKIISKVLTTSLKVVLSSVISYISYLSPPLY